MLPGYSLSIDNTWLKKMFNTILYSGEELEFLIQATKEQHPRLSLGFTLQLKELKKRLYQPLNPHSWVGSSDRSCSKCGMKAGCFTPGSEEWYGPTECPK